MTFVRVTFCVLLAVFFFVAGITHFTQDDSFAAIVPPLLPFKYEIVWITGGLELIFALGLLWPKYRQKTGFWLSLYLLAVLPANIYMAMAGIGFGDIEASSAALWLRVAMQFPLIALVLWASRPGKTI
ncbi:MAG: hypothetical protein ABJG88_00735 [Litorimonas sp.]